ncbi:hypothetical protein FRC00_000460, partial [Tulasnella sp. 408]
CPDPTNVKSCYAPISEYARHVQELTAELARNHGPDSPLSHVTEVIMMSDETDQEWWDEVDAMGWRQTRPYEDQIANEYGRRWPAIVDSIIQSRGAAFVGTSQSTMSIVAARRVMDWNKGPVRL